MRASSAQPLPRDVRRALAVLRRFGRDAVSFQGLGSNLRHWFDQDPPRGTGAWVGYADTGSAWVAAGAPVAAPADRNRAARRFLLAAREAGRRASFFATECRLEGFHLLCLGEQPEFRPGAWRAEVRRSRRLKEQLRRARAKGLRVRRVSAPELAEGTDLRAAVRELGRRWLDARPIEPMSFLVALEPFLCPEEHRYYVAELNGHPVQFLSAIPVFGRQSWFVEDLLRSAEAPNGTSEALLHALIEGEAASRSITLGLTPLSGPVAWWQRVLRALTRPLYHFRGLRAFRERLHPTCWRPVWLAVPAGESIPLHVVELLRAFAAGSLCRFALRSLLLHPVGPPWTLALALGGWSIALAGLLALGGAAWLGFEPRALGAWIAFDVVAAVGLFSAARRHRPFLMGIGAFFAGTDAVMSVRHLSRVGLGSSQAQAALRLVVAAAPLLGTLILLWATVLSVREARTHRAALRASG